MSFTFCPIEHGVSEDFVSEMLSEIKSIPEDHWHFNKFRGCRMLSFYNPGGKLGSVDISLRTEFEFTDSAKQCTKTIEFLKNNVINWMMPKGRITILRTARGAPLNEHIDCDLKESEQPQYKWRFVLSGQIDKLYFLNEKKEKIFTPKDERCYILDGGHPHSLDEGDEEKITICVGSPWRGDITPLKDRLKIESALFIQKPKIEKKWIDPPLYRDE